MTTACGIKRNRAPARWLVCLFVCLFAIGIAACGKTLESEENAGGGNADNGRTEESRPEAGDLGENDSAGDYEIVSPIQNNGNFQRK